MESQKIFLTLKKVGWITFILCLFAFLFVGVKSCSDKSRAEEAALATTAKQPAKSTKVSRLCWQSPYGKQACFSATIRLKDDQLVIWQDSQYAGRNEKAVYSGEKIGPDTYRGTWESSVPFQKGEFYITFYGNRAHGWSRETTPHPTPKYTLWLENAV